MIMWPSVTRLLKDELFKTNLEYVFKRRNAHGYHEAQLNIEHSFWFFELIRKGKTKFPKV